VIALLGGGDLAALDELGRSAVGTQVGGEVDEGADRRVLVLTGSRPGARQRVRDSPVEPEDRGGAR
jgi:hypothetical protein